MSSNLGIGLDARPLSLVVLGCNGPLLALNPMGNGRSLTVSDRPDQEERMEVDRRVFIASLGGAAWSRT